MKRYVLVFLVACDAGGAYLYSGNLYDPQRDCVNPTSIIDVLEGTQDPGSGCGAKCIAASDGGLPVYVTTMCGPVPVNADISGANPGCAPALAAFGRGDICLDGGGSTNPLDAAQDGGTD